MAEIARVVFHIICLIESYSIGETNSYKTKIDNIFVIKFVDFEKGWSCVKTVIKAKISDKNLTSSTICYRSVVEWIDRLLLKS